MDDALFWSGVALQANADDHTAGSGSHRGPTMSSRALAIVHLAVHDAWMGAHPPDHTRRYDTAGPSTTLPPSVRAQAMAAAAHKALELLYANNGAVLPTIAVSWTAYINAIGIPLDPAAAAFGEAVAAHILSLRVSDRDASQVDTVTHATWTESPGEGKYGRDPLNPDPAHGPFYGRNALFAANDRYSLNAPSSLTPSDRAAAYDEAKDLGAALELPNSRTAAQTTVAIFWGYDGARKLGTPPRLYNRIARQFAAAHGLSTEENIVLLAQVNAAMADAAILAWEQKYLHNHWRPVTAIREVRSSLGPDATGGALSPKADPFWRPLGAPRTNDPKATRDFTPPFPAYPSGHATFGAAALKVLEVFLAKKSVTHTAFDFVSEELDGVSTHFRDGVRPRHVRHFKSLRDAYIENGLSRVYLGVHWRYDAFVGDATAPTPGYGGIPLGLLIAADVAAGLKRSTVPAL